MISNNKRGVLVGKWSKNGKKFGIGTGDHFFLVGFYEPINKWWSTQPVGSFKSSVICADFHPSGKVVAAGSTDFSIKFITCFINKNNKNFENSADSEDTSYDGPFGDVTTFNETIFELSNAGSWVTSISFSPDGFKYAFATHSACIQFGKVVLNEPEQNQ